MWIYSLSRWQTFGFLRAEASCGVGQDDVLVEIEKLEQASPLLINKPLAPHRDGDDLAAAGVQRLLHQLVIRVLSGADEEAIADFEFFDFQRFGHAEIIAGKAQFAADMGSADV